MILWIAGAIVVAALLGSLSFLSPRALLVLKVAVSITAAVVYMTYATILFRHASSHYEVMAGFMMLGYFGLFAASLTYKVVSMIPQWRRWERAAREERDAAEQKRLAAERARTAAEIERAAAEERARLAEEERKRAALAAQRLADLEKWLLQTYAYYSVQVDFDGSKPFEERRAGFQQYIAGFGVPDLHILAQSRNPKVQALVQGFGAKALT